MIKHFNIEGFRAIGKKKNIELAPITILIGNNGSGKSSLIKGMITFPKLFNIKTIKSDEGFKNSPFLFKDILGTYKQVAGFLKLDPTDVSGNSISFDNIINKSTGKDGFSFGTKLPLRFFDGSHILNVTIKPNTEGFGEVSNFEIVETEKNESLIQIQSFYENKGGYLTFRIHLRKQKKQMFDTIKNIVNNEFFKQESFNSDKELEFDNVLNDSKQIFKKNLRSPFHKQTKLTYSEIEFINPIEDLLKPAYKSFAGKTSFFFNYSYNPDLIRFNRQSSEDDEKKDEQIDKTVSKAVNYAEKKAMENLSNGINIPLGAREKFISVENFIDSFLSDPTAFSEILESEVMKFLPKDISIVDDPDDKLSDFGILLLNEMFINNIQQAILNTVKEFNDIQYIAPYKVRLDSFNENKGSYQTIIKRLREIKQKNVWFGASEYFTEYWLKYFEIGERIEFEKLKNNQEQIYLVKGETNLPIEDQSFGLSQLIPIIYLSSFPRDASDSEKDLRFSESFFYMKEQIQSTFLIEEPESNLHPSNQSKLADLFIDAHWKFGHQFIVETHSEYLIRKLQYWVAKGVIKNDKIKIISFSNDKTEKGKKDVKIREILIKSNGDLSSDLDSGFFDESVMLTDMLRDLRKRHNN
jgi:predicted ATPase